MRAGQRKSIFERIANKFLIDDGCWEWTGAKNAKGYGMIGVPSDVVGHYPLTKAHRVLYELFVGPIPSGETIDHLCYNTSCVRPSHLEAVSIQENVNRRRTVGNRWTNVG